MFTSASLAGRIERAECELTIDMAGAAGARGGDTLVVFVGGGAAVFAGQGSPFTKVIGVGFEGAVDLETLSDVEAQFAARRAPVQVEVASLADPAVSSMLTARGYRLAGFENVLGRRLDDRRASPRGGADSAIRVRRVRADETTAWVDMIVTASLVPDGFDGPAPHESFGREQLEPVYVDYTKVPDAALYVAERHGETAGGAIMRSAGGLAQLCGAATLPAHRRRGVQTALLDVRLLDAARAGSDLVVVTTQPGSKSQENVQRAGFALLYTRAILVRS